MWEQGEKYTHFDRMFFLAIGLALYLRLFKQSSQDIYWQFLTTWKVSLLRIFLVCIQSQYGKMRTRKIRIWTLFTHYLVVDLGEYMHIFFIFTSANYHFIDYLRRQSMRRQSIAWKIGSHRLPWKSMALSIKLMLQGEEEGGDLENYL